ncbi:MAG TPA: preprotein translocase subunit SecY [Anaerolineaceae bacterium]|nr:preprotein translocase subunit SecY [Anaerolineaceae bacterium]HPN53697.1 preprotein translocase subunit SecY [Anaerolineaceae bacterium]
MKRSAWRYLFKSEDIRNKLLITFLLLALYRLAANIPVPNINLEALRTAQNATGAAGNFIDLINFLSGGTLANFSILAMGVYPYITAQIILQLLVPIIPPLERKMKENPREAQSWMEKWTVILTIPMALLSAIGQINVFASLAGTSVIKNFGFAPDQILGSSAVLLTMVGGTMFGIWLGQLISEYGIRNQGLSLIIFSGIVAQIPNSLYRILVDENNRWVIVVVLAMLVLTIFAIVYVQQGRRNVPVMFPGRRVGNRMSMPVRSTLPLMVNMAGMIPLIFAQSLLSFPALVASFFANSDVAWVKNLATGTMSIFGNGSPWYVLFYFIMVFAFTFFYTSVLFEQQNYGENLKKQGAQIPGVVRGGPTQRYLSKVQQRITLPGALFLALVATLPYIATNLLPISGRSGLFLLTSSGLLIVVGVVRDTFTIIDTELKLHGYEDRLIS